METKELTKTIDLLPYSQDYLNLIHKWHNDNYDLIGFNNPQIVNDTQALVNLWLNDTNRKWFFINHKDKIIGYVMLSDINNEYKSCMLHTLIGEKEYQGKRVCVELIDTILDYAFNTLKFHRIMTYVMGNNHKLYKTAIKYGFKSEGTLKEAIKYQDNYMDISLFRLLDYEFKPRLQGEKLCQQ